MLEPDVEYVARQLSTADPTMTQPTAYNRVFSFTDWEADYPSSPKPGVRLDAEFEALELTTGQIRTRLALIQRDDGELANESVGLDQLKPEVLAISTAQAVIAATDAEASAAAAETARAAAVVAQLAAEAAQALGQGDPGADGHTIITGTAAPTTEGANGDIYIRNPTTAPVLYGPKSGGAWPAGVSMVGAAGTNGTNGAAGSNGTNGTNGTNGASFLSGAGAPSSGLGVNGDYYLNTTNGDMYGPKAVGAWGATTGNLFTSFAAAYEPLGKVLGFNNAAGITLALSDIGNFIGTTNGSATTVTFPPNSSVAFPIGTRIDGAQFGAGQVTLTAGAGVALAAQGGALKTAAQYAGWSAIKTATNTWVIMGTLTT